MAKPLIGILGNRSEKALSPAYSHAVMQNGGLPIIVPFTECKAALFSTLSHCGGVIVPGGGDADPRLFGEDPHPGCGEMDWRLDGIQMQALEYLFANSVPVLGICRGCQMMNLFLGGSIYQDLGEFPSPTILHSQPSARDHPFHNVTVKAGSRLHKLLGASSVYTNSFHHQAVKTLGKGFAACAHTSDGVIEAIEHENGLWLSIQWHPEHLTETVPAMNALFRDLVKKAKK